jgi:pimeloyl-ACP methyl ester carboxylesterase
VTIVPGAGHSPHRDVPEATLNAISEFAGSIFHTDEGSQGRAA